MPLSSVSAACSSSCEYTWKCFGARGLLKFSSLQKIFFSEQDYLILPCREKPKKVAIWREMLFSLLKTFCNVTKDKTLPNFLFFQPKKKNVQFRRCTILREPDNSCQALFHSRLLLVKSFCHLFAKELALVEGKNIK